ncbi:hypothetical protein GCM10022279_22050 [Comamonas faecalis]|uniref:Uncharacterized protein n=1 Tax=Comamonas faecalis TaxID=1387849 RepID=A0ABP7RIA7_9BURK
MFILPLLLFPLILALSVGRLLRIARQLRSGALQCVSARARPVLWAATMCAYAALLLYTVALCLAVVRVLWVGPLTLAAFASLLAWVLAYPLVYFVAAWIFYYGLRRSAPVVQACAQPGEGA